MSLSIMAVMDDPKDLNHISEKSETSDDIEVGTQNAGDQAMQINIPGVSTNSLNVYDGSTDSLLYAEC